MIVGGKIFFRSSQQKIWMLMLQERRNLMAEKKLTIRVDNTIYEPFKAKCTENGFKTNDLFVSLMAECNSIIELAIALRDKEIRELLRHYIL